MKKFLLTVLLIICFVPCVALADMGAPNSTAYDVIITNPDGVTIGTGKRKTTIPFDTKVTVNYEYEMDGVLYGSVEYDGIYGEIELSDAKIYTTDIDLSKFNNDGKKELYVFKEGAYLYKGPSVIYGKASNDMIPVGTTLTYNYYDEMWAYVEYKGTKGWIYFYGPAEMYSDVKLAVASPIKDNNKVLMLKDIDKLAVNPRDDVTSPDYKAIEVNIPKGTEITYDLHTSLGHGEYIHIKYKDKEGWLSYVDYRGFADSGIIIQDKCTEGIVMKDVSIYSTFGDPSSKTNEVIKAGTKVTSIYSYREGDYYWNKVRYDNKEAWIAIETPEDDYDAVISIAYGYSYISVYRTRKEAPLYEDISESSKVLGTIPQDTKVEIIYSYYDDRTNWAYVEYNGVKGWVNSNTYLEYDSTKQKDKCSGVIKDDKTASKDNKKETLDNKDDTNEGKVQNILLKASLIAVGLAVAISVIVAVIIVSINRSKKKKQAIKEAEAKTKTAAKSKAKK